MKNKNIIWIIGLTIFTIIAWQFNETRTILLPFTVLGTWFHEMAHGIMAFALGGNFHTLELFPDGSGVAHYSGNLYFGNIGKALVAGAGPFGPTIAASIFFAISKHKDATKVLLLFMSIILLLSVLIWIRSAYGFIIIIAFSVAIGFIALKAKEKIQKISLQFLGVQAAASVYLSISYLFSAYAEMAVGQFASDTAIMAENLFLPHWVWGFLILLFSVIIIGESLKYLSK